MHGADVQDRDGAGPVLQTSRASWPFVKVVFADAGYQGPRVANASPVGIEIVPETLARVSDTPTVRLPAVAV